MNKKLIALAVAGACVAPAAMAQTANPVTLYGIVYVTVESIEAKGGSAPLSRRWRVEDQASRLGVRGTEDLGAGLKAFFQLETAFRPDQNTTTFAARNSGVGLQGGFGSVIVGRWDMPYKLATIAIDPFGDLTIGGITVANNDQGNFDVRQQNVLQYWSPNFAGFAFRGAISANEGKTATTNPRNAGASGTFTRGPIYAFLAWEEHKDPTATMSKETAWSGGGSFAFGPLKVGALYGEYKREEVPGTPHRFLRKSWLANAVYTMGNNQFIYQYQQSKRGGVAGSEQPDCDVNSVGYQYNFTRRTFFLAQYVKVDNNATSACGSGQYGATAGQDPQGISLGLRHLF